MDHILKTHFNALRWVFEYCDYLLASSFILARASIAV